MLDENCLGRRVRARTAYGGTQFEGCVVSYYAAPTVRIQLDDGTSRHWGADLCEVIHEEPLDVLKDCYRRIMNAGKQQFDNTWTVEFDLPLMRRIAAVLNLKDWI